MESLAKFFNHDFKEGNFRLYNSVGKKIYLERSDGFWYKLDFDKNGNETYYENSNKERHKREFDENNLLIYCENSTGYIKDKRPKYNGKLVVIDGIEYELRRKK